MDTPQEIAISLQDIFKPVFAGLAGIGIWLVKKLGDKHIASLDELKRGQERILEELSDHKSRIAVVEALCPKRYAQHHTHKESDHGV